MTAGEFELHRQTGSSAYGGTGSANLTGFDKEPSTSTYGSRYTSEEAQMVDQAKRIHRRTTDSASNALQTALKARDIGGTTLEELHRQDQQIDRIDRDLNEIDTDIQEAKGILKYMRRCCLCFLCACCWDCDPSKQADETRKQRVDMRKAMRAQEAQMFAQAGRESRASAGAPTAPAQMQASEDAQRGELMGSGPSGPPQRPSRSTRDNPAFRLGQELEDKDRDELQAETAKQELHLEQLGGVLGDLHKLGVELNETLTAQDEKLMRIDDRTGRTVSDLKDVQVGMRQDFNLKKNKGESSGPSMAKLKGLGHAAKAVVT